MPRTAPLLEPERCGRFSPRPNGPLTRSRRPCAAGTPRCGRGHSLPPHSPDPNPDELVDADLGRSLAKRHRAP